MNALVLSREPHKTTLEEFLLALHDRWQASPRHTMAGSAQWSDAPLMDMVADGLWPILLRSGEKLGRRVASPSAVQEVAQLVDRVLRGGLLLRYPSMEAAARAFWFSVVEPAFSASAPLIGKKAFAPAKLWQVLATTFFADLMRSAQATADRVELLIQDERRQPYLYPDHPSQLRVFAFDRISSIQSCAQYLRLTQDPRMVAVASERALRDLLADATHLRSLASLLRRLPIQVRLLPRVLSTTAIHPSIEETWMNTQVLLAGAGGPVAAETITADLFVRGMNAVRSKDPGTMLHAFLHRLSLRGLTMSAEETALMTRLVTQRIQRFRDMRWSGKIGQELVDEGTYFLDIDIAKIDIGRADAMRLISHSSESEPLRTRYGDAKTMHKIAAALPWQDLHAEQIVDIIHEEKVVGPALMRGLRKTNPEHLQLAVQRMLSDDAMDRDVVAEIYAQGISEPGALEYRLFLHVLPDDVVLKHLAFAFDLTTWRSKGFLAAFISRMETIPTAARRAALRRPALRASIQSALTESIFATGVGFDPNERRPIEELALNRIFGEALWQRFVFAEEIHYRRYLYSGSGDPEERERMYPAWTDLWDRSRFAHRSWKYIAAHVAMDAVKVKDLLTNLTEEDVLRWYAEGHADGAEIVSAYLADRRKYYAAWKVRVPKTASRPR